MARYTSEKEMLRVKNCFCLHLYFVKFGKLKIVYSASRRVIKTKYDMSDWLCVIQYCVSICYNKHVSFGCQL